MLQHSPESELTACDFINDQTGSDLDHFLSPARQTGKYTRREFLKLSVLAAIGLAIRRWDGVLAWSETHIDRLFQLDIPENTALRAVVSGESYSHIPKELLVEMNGPTTGYGDGLNTAVLWVPYDGDPIVDRKAEHLLTNMLVLRAMIGRDEKTDAGFPPTEAQAIQDMLPGVVKRVTAFAGMPYFLTGFARVFRPGEEEREVLRTRYPGKEGFFGLFSNNTCDICSTEAYRGAVETAGGGSMEGAFVEGRKDDGGKAFSIAILVSFSTDPFYQKMVEEQGFDAAWRLYTSALHVLLGHEYAHGLFGSAVDIPPFDLHNVVTTAGNTLSLAPLVDMSKAEIRRFSFWDSTAMESSVWKTVKKVVGREWYADLLGLLIFRHGSASLRFSESDVMNAAEELFSQYKIPFSFQTLRESIGKEPDEGQFPRYPFTPEYSYQPNFVQAVKRDSANPGGIVSWWLPVLWPSEVKTEDTERLWVIEPHQPFPDDRGYYTNYVFVGNGPIDEGPPGANRLAIAVWVQGGRKFAPNSDPNKDAWFTLTDSTPPKVLRATAEKGR